MEFPPYHSKSLNINICSHVGPFWPTMTSLELRERKTTEFWLVLSLGIIWYAKQYWKKMHEWRLLFQCLHIFCWIMLGFSGEFVHVNPYTGPPTWGELTEKAAQTMFYTVSSLFGNHRRKGVVGNRVGCPSASKKWVFGVLSGFGLPFRCPTEIFLRMPMPLDSEALVK